MVECTITDKPGPFRARLTKSGSVYNNQVEYKPEPVSGASVYITDDKGNDFHLFQGLNGWYETIDKCLQGTPGDTYTLHIINEEGSLFESTPQLMMDVTPIDSLYFEESQHTRFEGENVETEEWLDIFLDTHNQDGLINYFKWEFEETWEFNMPEYISLSKRGDSPVCVYMAEPGGAAFMTWVTIPPEQFHCWTTELSRSVLVKSTADNQVGEIKRFRLTTIAPENDRLSIRYSILVRQYILNKELYNYFRKLGNLNETNGGMYDKMPSPLYGNIHSVSGTKEVLGYFLVSAVKTKRIFINKNMIHIKTGHSQYAECGWVSPPLCFYPYYYYGIVIDGDRDIGTLVWSTDKYCADCRERGTNIKPDFW